LERYLDVDAGVLFRRKLLNACLDGLEPGCFRRVRR
jgi:hypothetical protein